MNMLGEEGDDEAPPTCNMHNTTIHKLQQTNGYTSTCTFLEMFGYFSFSAIMEDSPMMYLQTHNEVMYRWIITYEFRTSQIHAVYTRACIYLAEAKL